MTILGRKAGRRPRSWLHPIEILLRLILIANLLLLPLPLIWPGALEVGSGMPGDVFRAEHISSTPDLGANGVEVSLYRYGWVEHLLYATAHGLAFAVATIPMLFYTLRLITWVQLPDRAARRAGGRPGGAAHCPAYDKGAPVGPLWVPPDLRNFPDARGRAPTALWFS